MDEPLTIDDPEALRLLRVAAARTGRSEAEVLREALRSLTTKEPPSAAEMDALLRAGWADLVENPTGVEDLLYGEDGMPR